MLPKNERLKTSREFTAIYSLRKSVANSLLILYVGRKKANPEILSKVGFVAGKKVHKRANKRNHAKRLIREACKNIRKTDEFLPIENYEYMLFIARQPIVEANYNQVYDAVRDCFRKVCKKFC